MSFTVEISESRTVVVVRKDKWVQIGDTGGPDGGTLYGYAPPIEVTTTEKVELFEQTVEDLDLIAVIKAINGLTRGRPSRRGKKV